MTDAESALVDEIEFIRKRNNRRWMDILRIALATRPVETKAILRSINESDGEITTLLKKIADDY